MNTTSSIGFSRGALLLLLSSLPIVAVLAPGCTGKPGQFCNQRCECEHCNDIAEEACNIRESADQDRADAYDCGDEYDAYMECALERNDCDEETNNFTVDDSCGDEAQELGECIDDASSLNTAAQGPDGPISSAETTVTTTNVGGMTTTASSVASTASSTGGFGGNGGAGGM